MISHYFKHKIKSNSAKLSCSRTSFQGICLILHASSSWAKLSLINRQRFKAIFLEHSWPNSIKKMFTDKKAKTRHWDQEYLQLQMLPEPVLFCWTWTLLHSPWTSTGHNKADLNKTDGQHLKVVRTMNCSGHTCTLPLLPVLYGIAHGWAHREGSNAIELCW